MNTQKIKTCLIGGSGFIGHALAELLIRKGREVTIISRNVPSNPISGVNYIIGDYSHKKTLEQLEGLDEVIFLAYSSVPKTSFEDPFADILDNLPKVLEFFKVATQIKLKKVMIISSGGAVYGETVQSPITELCHTKPISPYGITKLALEKYALMYYAIYGLPIIIVRPGNVYGVGQKPYKGQGFIATAIASILEGKKLTQFGKQGTIRDYVYITDVAEGIFASLTHGKIGEIYNLGTGIGASNQAIIDKIASLSNKINMLPIIEVKPARDFDVTSNILDSTKLKKDTGWEAEISLDEGIKKTWDRFLKKTES